jgi:predicted dehydrogenase
VTSGQIGQLRTIQSFFSYFNADPQNIRNQSEIGGGALMDIGCYNISLSRFLYDAEPNRVLGVVDRDPNFLIDRLTSGILQFQEGTSTFTCGTQLTPYQRIHAFGTKGRLEIEIPFKAPPDRPCKAWLQRDSKLQEITFDICNQYQIQGDLFSKSILDDTEVPTPLSDALHNMRVIEAILDSAQTKQWVSILS